VAGGVLTPVTANILGNTRSRNVVRYDSIMFKPDAASLLNFSLAWTKNAAGAQNTVWPTTTSGSTYEGGQTVYGKALFNGHGVSASFSYLDQKFQGVLANAFDTELKAWRLGASYKVEGFKIGVVVDRSDMVNGLITAGVLSDAKRTVFSVPASYSFGDHAVYATYTKAGNTSSLDNTGANQLNLVYDYAMTKRAFVGVFYTKIQNDTHGYYSPFLAGYSAFGGSQIATGESWRQIGVNLNYWF
jgi:predicted porin